MQLSNKTLNLISHYNKLEPNSIIEAKIYFNNEKYSFSLGNKESKEDSYFQIGSNTKLYTALLISKLVSENKINYSDTIDKYFSLNKKYNYPTIENLLTHFGYRPHVSFKFIINSLFKKHQLYRNVYNNIDSIILNKRISHMKPPKKLYYYYSDMNYAILGLIIEKVCNEEYRVVMEKFIKEELGLTKTCFYPNGYILDSYHKKRCAKRLEWNKGDIFIAAGGLSSTIEDAYNFIKLTLDNDKPYICENTKKRKTILFGRAKIGVGYGWHSYVNGQYFFHKGGVCCFRSNYIVNTKKKIGIAILTNVVGNIHYNASTLGMSIYRDVKEALKNQNKN